MVGRRKKQWIVLAQFIIAIALARGVPAFAQATSDPEPVPKNGVVVGVATVPAAALVDPNDFADGPTPFRGQVTLLQGLNTWLTGSVWVTRSAGGFSYHTCYELPHLRASLPNAEAIAAVQAMGTPDGSRALTETVNAVRPAFEQLVGEYESDGAWILTDSALSVALREMVLAQDMGPDLQGAVASGLQRAGYVVEGAEIVSDRATTCTTYPCCGEDGGTGGCGSCTSHPCDCGICNPGRKCSCASTTGPDSCGGAAFTCSQDEPATLRFAPSLSLGW